MNISHLLGFNFITKEKTNTSKIYFIGLENVSVSLTSMKELMEKLVQLSCPKCENTESTDANSLCKCKKTTLEFEKYFKKLLFPTEKSELELETTLKSIGTGKTVCGKILKSKDIGFKCMDCELDATCIICQECFEKSNHKGHRTILQSTCSGCCDCGDREAWKEEGFCSDHSGFKGNELEKIKLLSESFKKNYFESFRMLFYLFFAGCEDFFTRCGPNKPSSKLIMIWKLILKLLKNLNKNDNLILNALLFELLKNGLDNPGYKLSHECGNLQTIDIIPNKSLCKCSILENIFRFNLLLEKENQKQISEMCINLFGFYDFKIYLILVYAKMFSFCFVNNKKKLLNIEPRTTSLILDLDVQLFTSDELVKKLIDNEIFDNFLDFFVKELNNIKAKPDNFNSYRAKIMIHHLENICSKSSLCLYLCNKKMLFFDKFLQMLAACNHIVYYDIAVFKDRTKIEEQVNIIDFELYLLDILSSIFKSAISAMDPNERNPFLDYILCSLIKLMRKDEFPSNSQTFHLPIQRSFMLALSMKLYYNKNLFQRKQLEQYLLCLNFVDIEELHVFLINQFSIMSSLLIFLKEIEKGFWKDYSPLMSVYTKIHQNGKFCFFDLDVSFFQILMFLLSEVKSKKILLENFFIKNKKTQEFFNNLKNGEFSIPKDKNQKSQENSDKKKKGTQENKDPKDSEKETIDYIEEMMNILIICINPIKFSFINTWSFITSDPEIEEIKYRSIEKLLQGFLIQDNNLDMKSIKSKTSLFLSDSFKFENILENIAILNPKAKSFRLKKENLENIDPFLYIKDSTIFFETFEKLQGKYKDFEILNLGNTYTDDKISLISNKCLLMITNEILPLLIEIIKKNQLFLKYPSFLKRTVKIFYEILIFLKNSENSLKSTLSSKDLRNSLISLQESNIFFNVRISLDKILEKLDEITLDSSLSLIKKEKSVSSEENSSQISHKKALFLQKQKALKESFQSQQAKFLLKNQEYLEEEFKTSHHQKVCVICKEEIDEKLDFGQCAFFNKSNIYKYAVYQQNLSLGLEETDDKYNRFYDEIDIKSEYFKDIPDQFCFSSCFHYIHYTCFQDFAKMGNNQEYILDTFEYNCPLCHRLSNIFIPGSKVLEEFEGFEIKNLKKTLQEKKFEGNPLKFYGKEETQKKEKDNYKLKINGFFDDLMKLECVLEENYEKTDTVVEILENAVVSVIRSLSIMGFNYFLNKNLVIYRNLLQLYKIYSNQFYESPTKQEFILKRKQKIENLRDLLTNSKNYVNLMAKNIDTLFIEYFIYSFIYFYWQPDEFLLHISYIFNFTIVLKALQYIFKRNHKNHDYKLEKVKLLSIFKEKEFLKIYLNCVKTNLSMMFMIFSFDESLFRDLNNQAFISDDEELNYLKELVNLLNEKKNPEIEIIETFYPLFEEFYNNSYKHFHSLTEEKEQFLYIYEALKIEKDLYFKLYDLDQKFSDLMSIYSNKKCELCHNYSKIGELCLCLICGAAICNRSCFQILHMKGNLNVHSLENHCGCSVFINMQNSEIFYIASPKNYAEKNQLYSDKYGQIIKLKNSDWGSYGLNIEEYNLVKEIVLKNRIPEEIWYRTIKNNVFFKANVF